MQISCTAHSSGSLLYSERMRSKRRRKRAPPLVVVAFVHDDEEKIETDSKATCKIGAKCRYHAPRTAVALCSMVKG
jgi:hypothetical protein